jgi:glycosyltransferase involved in cell wall biosynthesis
LRDILFSIVIACFDQEGFVKEAVESALSQSHPGKEIIVVDDASRDGTAAVLETFGPSITLAKLPVNGGAAAARNHGASLAKGDYLVFLDGDDVLMPGALDVYARLLAARSPELIIGRPVLFHGKVPDADPRDLPSGVRFVEYADFLSKDRPCLMNSSSLVVRRSAFWSAGGWSQGIFYQDMQDLMTKLGVSRKMVLVLSPGTVWYRMHLTNAILKVSPFLKGIRVLMAKARSGAYPGGRERRMARWAWFGGLIFYWTKEAMRTGIYREGFQLLAAGWWMILVAVIRRGASYLMGRKPAELLPLEPGEPAETAT